MYILRCKGVQLITLESEIIIKKGSYKGWIYFIFILYPRNINLDNILSITGALGQRQHKISMNMDKYYQS